MDRITMYNKTYWGYNKIQYYSSTEHVDCFHFGAVQSQHG